MLHIYTSKRIPKGSRLIVDVEARYLVMMTENWGELKKDKTLLSFYEHLDKATLTEELYLKTKFGYASMFNCCTSTKAAILAYYYRDQPKILVNITECGEDAIQFLAEQPYDFKTYISADIFLGESDIEVKFNGKVMTLTNASIEVLREAF